MKQQKTAIILGATGLTGNLLLEKLIDDPNYTTIKVFTRRKTNNASLKIKEYVIDVFALENHKTDFTADEVFCCIGTTASKTKDKSIYKKIDFGIPTTAAKLAKENNIETFVVVSAMGANKNSRVFYNKTKGEMEEAVLNQKIKHTYILRPSLIKGDRKESRLGEIFGNLLANIINPLLIGNLKKYRSISADSIAQTMQIIVKNKPLSTILLSDEIQQITQKINK